MIKWRANVLQSLATVLLERSSQRANTSGQLRRKRPTEKLELHAVTRESQERKNPSPASELSFK